MSGIFMIEDAISELEDAVATSEGTGDGVSPMVTACVTLHACLACPQTHQFTAVPRWSSASSRSTDASRH
jgi:hypothetical protein